MAELVSIEVLRPRAPIGRYRDASAQRGDGVRITLKRDEQWARAAMSVPALLLSGGLGACVYAVLSRPRWQGVALCMLPIALGVFGLLALWLHSSMQSWRNRVAIECRPDGYLTRRSSLRWMFQPQSITLEVPEMRGVRVMLDGGAKRGSVLVRDTSGTYGLAYDLAATDAAAVAHAIRRVLPQLVDDGT